MTQSVCPPARGVAALLGIGTNTLREGLEAWLRPPGVQPRINQPTADQLSGCRTTWRSISLKHSQRQLLTGHANSRIKGSALIWSFLTLIPVINAGELPQSAVGRAISAVLVAALINVSVAAQR